MFNALAAALIRPCNGLQPEMIQGVHQGNFEGRYYALLMAFQGTRKKAIIWERLVYTVANPWQLCLMFGICMFYVAKWLGHTVADYM